MYATLRMIGRVPKCEFRMGNASRVVRLAGLATISPLGAIIGGLIDERVRLGYTTWRSACRATGISFASVFHFTLELLPNAVIGALLGALTVQGIAFMLRPHHASACLAAHLGCAITMPAGLALCALALPIPLMLLLDLLLALAVALLLHALLTRNSPDTVPLHP